MNWINEDLVAILKFVSVVLTGTFGVFGALYNFKDKDGKITKWGRRNLCALVACLLIAVVSFVFEQAVLKRKAQESAAKAQKLLSTATAILDPLNRIEVSFIYSLPLSLPVLKAYREDLRRLDDFTEDGDAPTTSGYYFPDRQKDRAAYEFLASGIELDIRISTSEEEVASAGESTFVSFEVADGIDEHYNERQMYYNPEAGRLRILSDRVRVSLDEFFFSKRPLGVDDLPGATIDIYLYKGAPILERPAIGLVRVEPLEEVELDWVFFELPGGRSFHRDASEMTVSVIRSRPMYSFRLPDDWDEILRR